jgi:2-methylcitrate dehydratase PrpD
VPESIEKIIIGVTTHAKNRAIDAYPWSEDSSRFCPRYIIASTFVHGPPGISTFTDEALGDERVRRLADKCEVVVDQELDCMTEGVVSPGRVTVVLDNGTQHEKAVLVPAGTRTTPMSADRREAKFMSCATRAMDGGRAQRLHGYMRRLGEQEKLDDLWALLHSTPGNRGS